MTITVTAVRVFCMAKCVNETCNLLKAVSITVLLMHSCNIMPYWAFITKVPHMESFTCVFVCVCVFVLVCA